MICEKLASEPTWPPPFVCVCVHEWLSGGHGHPTWDCHWPALSFTGKLTTVCVLWWSGPNSFSKIEYAFENISFVSSKAMLPWSLYTMITWRHPSWNNPSQHPGASHRVPASWSNDLVTLLELNQCFWTLSVSLPWCLCFSYGISLHTVWRSCTRRIVEIAKPGDHAI